MVATPTDTTRGFSSIRLLDREFRYAPVPPGASRSSADVGSVQVRGGTVPVALSATATDGVKAEDECAGSGV